MRGQFLHQTQVVTFASNTKESSAFDLTGGPNRVAFEFPAFGNDLAATTSNVFVKVCATESGTFRRLQDTGIYSASSGIQDWEIPSITGNKTVLCRPIVGFSYGKLEMAQTATNGYAATVHKIF